MKKNIKKNVYLCIPEPFCCTAETGKHYKSAILQWRSFKNILQQEKNITTSLEIIVKEIKKIFRKDGFSIIVCLLKDLKIQFF